MNPSQTTPNEAPETQPITPEELVTLLRGVRERIPEYVQLSNDAAKVSRPVASLDPAFRAAAISTVGASDLISKSVGLTADEIHQLNDEAERWSTVIDELRALMKGVTSANLTRRHRVGLATLQTYSIAQQLARHADHADLLPHVADMKRTNRLGGRRKKANETPPAPPTTPPPTTPPQHTTQ